MTPGWWGTSRSWWWTGTAPGTTPGGDRGILSRLDVTAGRQPQPGQAVIDQEHAPVARVGQDRVGHQVPGRRRGLDPAVDVGRAGQPGQHARLMGTLGVVVRLDGGDE